MCSVTARTSFRCGWEKKKGKKEAIGKGEGPGFFFFFSTSIKTFVTPQTGERTDTPRTGRRRSLRATRARARRKSRPVCAPGVGVALRCVEPRAGALRPCTWRLPPDSSGEETAPLTTFVCTSHHDHRQSFFLRGSNLGPQKRGGDRPGTIPDDGNPPGASDPQSQRRGLSPSLRRNVVLPSSRLQVESVLTACGRTGADFERDRSSREGRRILLCHGQILPVAPCERRFSLPEGPQAWHSQLHHNLATPYQPRV